MFIKCFQGKCQASGMPSCLCERGAARHTGRFLSSWVVFIAGWRPPSWMPQHNRSALPKATLDNKEGSNAAHGFDEGLATAMEQIRAGQSWTWATAGGGAEPVGGEITWERAQGQWGPRFPQQFKDSLQLTAQNMSMCQRFWKFHYEALFSRLLSAYFCITVLHGEITFKWFEL